MKKANQQNMSESKKRQAAFKAIAITIPFLVLIILEISLRAFHYGYSSHLFIENPSQPGNFITNTQISKVFFSDKKDARQGIRHSFRKVKSPGTFRIFVLGESSAFGYPYTQRGSFSRMLEYRLAMTFREKNIEMINLSITAINSYALLSFGDEIMEMEPDAILIYAGHNEYYGALGVGSTHLLGSHPTLIKMFISLKKLKISQLAINFSEIFKSPVKIKSQNTEKGFMQRMSGEQKIVLGSELYNKGIGQFESNMDELLSKFNKRKIPVFFANMVNNERGQKPFISALANSTDTTHFFRAYRAGLKLFLGKDYDAAEKSFLAANLIDSTYAMNNYLMGEVSYLKGDFVVANKYYSKAKESDALRFRAPEAINGKILKLSQKYKNIHFVDARKEFIENSTYGILDNKLFLDHLHPNLQGYFLLSDAFYRTMKKSRLIGNWNDTISIQDSWKELPVTAVDSVYGTWMSLIMKEQWPFYEKTNFTPDMLKYPEKLCLMIFKSQINIEVAQDSLYRYYLSKNIPTEALRVVKSVDLDHPGDWKLSFEAGRLNAELLNFEESVYYYKKSFAEFKQIETARKIVYGLMQLNRTEESRSYLEYLIQNQPNDKMAIELLDKLNKSSSVIRP